MFRKWTTRYKSYYKRQVESWIRKFEAGDLSFEDFKKKTGFGDDAITRKCWKKRWICATSPRIERRVWKKAIFAESVFFSRSKTKSGPTIYHICLESEKLVVYGLVERHTDNPVCKGCGDEIAAGAVMMQRLAQLS